MVRRPAGGLRINPAKPKLRQIEPVDKHVNRPNRIILANPVFKTFRKQRVLPAIRALNKPLHLIPSQIAQESYPENHINQRVFTQPGSQPEASDGAKRPVCSKREDPKPNGSATR